MLGLVSLNLSSHLLVNPACHYKLRKNLLIPVGTSVYISGERIGGASLWCWFNSKIHNWGICWTGLRSVEYLGEINQYGKCLTALNWRARTHTHTFEVLNGLKYMLGEILNLCVVWCVEWENDYYWSLRSELDLNLLLIIACLCVSCFILCDYFFFLFVFCSGLANF